jgi:N-acetylmuramoyl-L-alanine amidase
MAAALFLIALLFAAPSGVARSSAVDHQIGSTAAQSSANGGWQAFLTPQAFRAGPRARSRYSLTIPLDPPLKALPLPPVEGPRDGDRPLVVIDAGHGGHDPGAIAQDGMREKDLTLTVARAVRDALLAGGRVRVAMTRDEDQYLVHRERFEAARQLGADMFISIHADAAPVPGARGATIYTLSETASDREAATLAARENRSDIINGVDLGRADAEVTSILIDLTQRETMQDATRFARLLKREATGIVPFRPDYHRTASLIVLKAPDVPSILFECGYITNVEDAAFLRSADGRRRIAEGFRRAVEIHFARRMAGG